MKSLVLSTSSNETAKYWQSLEQFGEVKPLIYDTPGSSETLLYASVKEFAPDFIVYVGSRWGLQPSQVTLARINAHIAPMIHFCSDAGDQPWHDLLREYADHGCFSLQVNIDGNDRWPGASAGMTTLTPVELKHFPAVIPRHADRTIAAGFAGNTGSGPISQRTIILTGLLERRVLDLRVRSPLPFTYEAYCDYLTKVRMSLNIAYSGTEQAKQVKGRVIETALGGAMLLETAGSPTAKWFEPGVDYLEYASIDQAADYIKTLSVADTQGFADRLRAKVLRDHSPTKFWQTIFKRLVLTP